MLDLPKDSDFGELDLKIILKIIPDVNDQNRNFCPGVCHADELMLMFSSNLIPPMTDPNDIKVSKMIFDLWTSFSANGFAL